MDFIAIDFETANRNNNSACSLGLAVVEDLKIIETKYYLIQPPTLEFDNVNMQIHGIEPDDVCDKPKFPEIWEEIKCYFAGQCTIIAHNVAFDMSVLKCCLNTFNLDIPDFIYVDSITLSNKFCPGCKRSLKDRTAFLGVELENHHNGLEDAIACASIVLECIKKTHYKSFNTFMTSVSEDYKHNFYDLKQMEKFCTKNSSGKQKKDEIKNLSEKNNKRDNRYHYRDETCIANIVCNCESVDMEHPFVNKNVVFTGDLFSMSRDHACLEVINCGGIVKSSVSPKTDFLIVGTQEKSVVGDKGVSSKQEKVNILNENGCSIKILSEADFLFFLDNYPRLVKSESHAYLILLKTLGLSPITAKSPKQIYFRNRQGNYIECKVNKVAIEYPKVVEIEFKDTTLNIALDYLKEMQSFKKEIEINEDKSLALLDKITKAIDPRLLTAAQLEIKKSEAKSKSSYDRIIMKLKSNSYRIERPSNEILLARMKESGNLTYISVAEKFKPILEKLQLQYSKTNSDPFLRIDLDYFLDLFNVENKVSILFNEIIVISLDYSPFDCCSRYLECSNAKECVHPDYLYASCACGYKKQLDNGRIFYGDNRNI